MTTPPPAPPTGAARPHGIQHLVADSADSAGLHATVPALLLELQTQLGTLAATATVATERGRRPFRPPGDWAQRLGELAYGVYLLADQSNVDVERETARAAADVARRHAATDDHGWPFDRD